MRLRRDYTVERPSREELTIIRTCRSAAAALAVAAITLSGATATAHAETADEKFVEAVHSLGIETTATPEELAQAGHRVCDMLTSGLTGSPNPVPVVRGVVSTLSGNGMSREQAVGLMRASVIVYCPQWGRYIGR